MAFGDLEIEIIIKEKWKTLCRMSEKSNNDILDMAFSWPMYLEKRIGDLGYKVASELKLTRIS